MDVTVEGTVVHVETREGSGDKVVLVHGWAVSSAVWAPTLARWTGDEALFAVDLRGAGFSDKPATGYTLEAYARDVAGVIEAIGGPVILVGHSMGGTIAQLLAVQRPELVTRLVLVAPAPAGGVPLPEADRAFFRSLAGRYDGMKIILGSMMAAGGCDDFDTLHACTASVLPACYLEALDAWSRADFADRLAELDLPVHVIGGAAESVLTPAILNAGVVELIAGARFEALEGLGHYPQWEGPETFAKVLMAAVRG